MDLPGFCAPSGESRDAAIACDRTVNMYLEELPNERGKLCLYSLPGLRPVAELPSAPVRGLYTTTTGRTFAVTSSTLFEVFEGWTFLSRGSVPNGTQPVSMTDNGLHLVLSVEDVGLAYDLATNVLTTIVPADSALTFGHLAYIDGYVLTNQPNTTKFWHSALLNALSWPALNYYGAEGRPDTLTTIHTDHREVWCPGSQTVEVWHSTGSSAVPFARMDGVFLEQGCQSPDSFASLDNTVFWLGGTPRGEGPVWMAQGYSPVRVSNHALEIAMGAMPTVADAVAFTARHGGHAWYGLDFPTGGETWVYDTATGAWMEIPRLNDNGSFGPFLANQHCVAFGVHLWGSRDSGVLYVWDPRYHYYGTTPRYCARIGPFVRDDDSNGKLTFASVALRCLTGHGLDGGVVPGSDPVYRLSWTENGQTWSYEHVRSAGRIGAYERRVIWRQLGQSRSRAFKIATTEPILHAWRGLTINGD